MDNDDNFNSENEQQDIDNEFAMQGDDDDDNAPAFIQADDDGVVEVQVDEDDVPMDDDNDDDNDNVVDSAAPAAPDASKLRLAAHSGPVFCVASHYSPDTHTLSIVSGGGDDKAFLHCINASNETTSSSHFLEHAHTDSVSSVAMNVDYVDENKIPRMIAVGAYDGAVCVYDYDSQTHLHTYEGPTDVEWLAFHPKGGSVLLVGSAADYTVWMFHLMLKQCLQVFVGHTAAVTCGCFSSDGKWALSASSDGSLRVWAPRTGNAKHVIRFNNVTNDEEAAGLTCMSVNGGADGQLVIVGAEDGQAHVCHVKTGKVVASLRHYQVPTNMPMSSNDDDDDDEVDLPMSVEAVSFCPSVVNPNWVATGGCDGVLKIWDLTNGQCRQICNIADAAAVVTNDAAAATQQPLSPMNTTGGITRLQWHPTLPLVFTSCTNGSIYIWDARNGRLVHTMAGSDDVINDMNICFVDEGRKAIVSTACDDNLVRVHDVDVMAVMEASVEMRVHEVDVMAAKKANVAL
ncbi:hypothetical protein MPSEU_000972000 [Mayamaea pseudoterrestris]|nr:hypothetical protein MPSEU_000972000 [Mayamaea pseudoterrestris]